MQIGAALATTLFDEVGPAGTVFYRMLFAALVLLAIWRPALRGHDRETVRLIVLFGISLAAMNLCFYSALDRIPLGIAVTLEFVGPLTVAVASSRTRLDVLFVVLAAAGIVLIAGPGGQDSPDGVGMALALAAGGFWGAYILFSARLGRAFSGGGGLALALIVATALLAAPGIAVGGQALLDPYVIAIGAAVALLSALIPFSFELEALRRLRVGVFGVLMSMEPGVGALVGLVALGQGLSATEAAGIGLVVAASVGVLRQPGAQAPRDA